MNISEMIKEAEKRAIEKANCFGDECFNEKGYAKVGSEEYKKAVQKSKLINPEVEFNNVICEARINFSKSNKSDYFSYRFYLRRENGKRSNISKQRAFEILAKQTS